MKSRNIDMLSGSITKGLAAMTMPIMIMNVMQPLFNLVDMTVLKIFVNDRPVGAVGACGILIALFTSLVTGISVGVNVIVAERIGCGNKERAGSAVMTSFLFSVIIGLMLMAIGITFAEAFLNITNCPDELLPYATLYFKIYFYGMPVLSVYTFCVSILRAIGDAKKPMLFLILGGIIKILITFLCVSAFDMSVDGVAISTVISNTIACTLAIYAVAKGQSIVCLNFKKIKIDFAELKNILFIGVPTALQISMYSLANVIIVTAVNSFGADATTGIAIANQFDGILYQISTAPALAVTPYVAQNIGAGNISRANQTFMRGVFITTVFGAGLGFLSAAFSGQLSSIMSSNPVVIGFSRQKMIIISSTYFICGINEVLCGVLRGMKKPIIPTVSTLLFMCVLRFIWVYAIFPLKPNLTFLYLVWPVGWILSIMTLLPFYFSTLSKLHKKNTNAL